MPYDGTSTSLVVDKATITALVTGSTYRFRYRAVNEIGNSDYSPIASVALAALPN